ncbi:D-alanyl-D-alanine carboxypeptidase family protein [Desulfovibrio falkowii]|uniref:Peptidase S11 D-alanyl-D-alanine carboxypeptidase A N-terminal domain-containing protein n=1 Tax=Desulfovibrio falkowii TaxID=3136602 RepID=A0ABQ0E8E6_9BACT
MVKKDSHATLTVEEEPCRLKDSCGQRRTENSGTSARPYPAYARHGALPWATARLAVCLLWLCLIAICAVPGGAQAAMPVRSAILINMDTGKILYAKNPDMAIPPASLTKVMTMYLAMDQIRAGKIKPGEKIRITPQVAAVGGSSMHLRAGERVALSQLLTGMAVVSGNDAATAVARRVGGNDRQFVRAMNQKAKALGMNRTTFKNPTGLPAAGQKTTARDMARMTRAYLRSHPSALRYHSVQLLTYRDRKTRNTNGLLGTVAGVNGLKTGWTVASGYNLIVTGQRGKTRMLAVVMGGTSRVGRDNAARRLIEAGFRHPASPKKVQQMFSARKKR